MTKAAIDLPPAVFAAARSGATPAYVYDLAALDRQCRALERLPLARASIFFATMANDHPAILDWIRHRGHGVFVNSPQHLALALDIGFAPERIVYAASNMRAGEMIRCADRGVRLVLDSIGQIGELVRTGREGLSIGVRVDVGSALAGGGIAPDPTYRFGLTPDELTRAVGLARRAGLRINGIHSYFGTDVLSADVLVDGLARLCAVAPLVPDLRYVDVAGGLGVGRPGDASFELERYGQLAAAVIADCERRVGRRLELVIEPGRFLTADCGFFFVTVIDIKHRPMRTFVGTDGSVAIFPRPLIHPDRAVHPIGVLGPRAAATPHDRPICVCGNSTYSNDFLARDVRMTLPEPGDRLVLGLAGAYCRSMMTDFLGKERPDETVVSSSIPALPTARLATG